MKKVIKNNLGTVVKTRYFFVKGVKYRYVLTKTNSKTILNHFISVFQIGDKVAIHGTSLFENQLGSKKEKDKATELVNNYNYVHGIPNY